MLRNLLITQATAFFWLGSALLPAGQVAKVQPATSQSNQSQQSVDAEMMDHQREMQSLATNLVQNFQAIANARDKKGFVRDNSMLKEHTSEIKALRDAYRLHEILVKAYERDCSIAGRQADAMVQHQQLMKSVLYDLVDTFDTYENANAAIDNPNIVAVEYNGEAIAHHEAALKELTAAVAQHQQAIGQMNKDCP